MKVSNGRDETVAGDYFADADDPRVQKDLEASTTGTPIPTAIPTTSLGTPRPAEPGPVAAARAGRETVLKPHSRPHPRGLDAWTRQSHTQTEH